MYLTFACYVFMYPTIFCLVVLSSFFQLLCTSKRVQAAFRYSCFLCAFYIFGTVCSFILSVMLHIFSSHRFLILSAVVHNFTLLRNFIWEDCSLLSVFMVIESRFHYHATKLGQPLFYEISF